MSLKILYHWIPSGSQDPNQTNLSEGALLAHKDSLEDQRRLRDLGPSSPNTIKASSVCLECQHHSGVSSVFP